MIYIARKPRLWFPGAMYHITSRGNRKDPLFYHEIDFLKYLRILEETQHKHPFYIHAYCLMPNHIHLQLETTDTHIKHIMRRINTGYAVYFNKRYDLVGHVFQGRYGAKLIQTIDYELKVNQYIHLNPVEAGIVSRPEQYRWSSYAAYFTNEKPPFLHTEKILNYFPHPTKKHFRDFILGGQTPEFNDIIKGDCACEQTNFT